MTPFERPVVPDVNMMRASSVHLYSTPSGSPSEGGSISSDSGSHFHLAGSGPAWLPVCITTTYSSSGSSSLIRSRRSRYRSEMTSFFASTRLIVQERKSPL